MAKKKSTKGKARRQSIGDLSPRERQSKNVKGGAALPSLGRLAGAERPARPILVDRGR